MIHSNFIYQILIIDLTVELNCCENVPAGIYGYALVIAKKLVSMSSDGQRQFDLI